MRTTPVIYFHYVPFIRGLPILTLYAYLQMLTTYSVGLFNVGAIPLYLRKLVFCNLIIINILL